MGFAPKHIQTQRCGPMHGLSFRHAFVWLLNSASVIISVSFCTQKLLQGLPRGKGRQWYINCSCSPALLFLSFAPSAGSRISVPSYRNWQEGSFHLLTFFWFQITLEENCLHLVLPISSANVFDLGMVYFSKAGLSAAFGLTR